MRLLATYSQILVAFNSKVEALVSAIDEQMLVESMNECNGRAERLRIQDWFQADLSQYRVEDVGYCIVSHILDSENKVCFVVDSNK